MSVNTSDFSIWKKDIQSYVIQEEKNARPLQIMDIFGKGSTSDLYMIDKNAAGMGPMEEVGENGNAIEDSPIEGYSYTFRRKNFRKKFVISKNSKDGDKVGGVEAVVRNSVNLPKESRELWITGIIRRAFDTTQLGGDGKTLGHPGHLRKDGGTAQSNTFLDGVQRPLTYDNFMRLQDVAYSVVSHSGNPLNTATTGARKILYTTPQLREKAYQIAGDKASDSKKPGTDENDYNYIEHRENCDVIILDRLSFEFAKLAGETGTATKSSGNWWDLQWGIIDREQAKKCAKVIDAPGYPYDAMDVNLENEAIERFIYDAYQFGFNDWIWIFPSKGDGTTVS